MSNFGRPLLEDGLFFWRPAAAAAGTRPPVAALLASIVGDFLELGRFSCGGGRFFAWNFSSAKSVADGTGQITAPAKTSAAGRS
jgi:hypothetical protein